MCTVYCVPEGQCEQLVQTGSFQHLGINEEGNCRDRGFTEEAIFDDAPNQTHKFFQPFTGACKGMSLIRYRKEVSQDETDSKERVSAMQTGQDPTACNKETVPFMAIHPW